MKIYVSDKDQNKYVYYYGGGRESIECKSTTEPMVVSSLEQHEAEIRKPLEDEIEKLKAQQFKLAVEKLEELELGVILERGAIMGYEHREQFNNGFDLACFRMENQIKKMTEELKQKLKEIKE